VDRNIVIDFADTEILIEPSDIEDLIFPITSIYVDDRKLLFATVASLVDSGVCMKMSGPCNFGSTRYSSEITVNEEEFCNAICDEIISGNLPEDSPRIREWAEKLREAIVPQISKSEIESFRKEYLLMKKSETWYIVINDGNIITKSRDEDVAKAFAEEQNELGAEDSAEEYGYDPDSPAAAYQNGYDGGLHEVERVVIPVDADDELEIDAGSTSYTVGEIFTAPELDEEYFLE